MLPSTTARRFIPSFIGLVLFVVAAALYVHAPDVYRELLTSTGFKPWLRPFIDSEFMYVMKASWLRGVNVYQGVTDHAVGEVRMNYSPLWTRLPLPSDKAWTVPVAVVTDLALLASVAVLSPARSWRDVILLSLAVNSTMVFYALERNNIDVWIYLGVVAGGLLLARSALLRLAAYGIFVLLAALKYYPLTLLACVASERPRRAAAITLVSAAVLGVFVVGLWSEISQGLQAVPSGWPGGDLIGIVNLPRSLSVQVSASLGVGAGVTKSLEIVLRAALTAAVVIAGIRMARDRGMAAAFSALDRQSTIWLVAGCLLMCGCLFLGQNVGYRGIFMLFTLTGLLALLRVAADGRVARRLRFATGLVVVLMWMEGLRYWAASAVDAVHLGAGPARLIWTGLLILREVLWLDMERIMVAAIVVFLLQSACGVWAQRMVGRTVLPA